jgi:hypothetical protein
LRVTWHADTRTVVLSHWNGALCTASTRVALADMSRLIVFLVNALDRSARAVPSEVPGPETAGSGRPGRKRPGSARPVFGARAAKDRAVTALAGMRRHLGPRLAQVVSIGEARRDAAQVVPARPPRAPAPAPGEATTVTAPWSPPAPLGRDHPAQSPSRPGPASH